MHTVPDKLGTDDIESAFDFLDSESGRDAQSSVETQSTSSNPSQGGDERLRSGSEARSSTFSDRTTKRKKVEEKPFPVIRKPVCVSQSGPLRPPQPGDPVEPPPPLTEGLRRDPPQTAKGRKNEPDDLGQLNLDDDDWLASDNWPANTENTYVPGAATENYGRQTSSWRGLGYVLAFLMLLAGSILALYSNSTFRDFANANTANLVRAVQAGISQFNAPDQQDPALSDVPASNANVALNPDNKQPVSEV